MDLLHRHLELLVLVERRTLRDVECMTRAPKRAASWAGGFAAGFAVIAGWLYLSLTTALRRWHR